MNSLRQPGGALRWDELLSSEEIIEWMTSHRKPRRLWRRQGKSRPIVYRFIFPEFADENGSHTSCYVGEGGDFGRLSSHFSSTDSQEKRNRDGELILDKMWQVKGAVQNSRGELRLEILHIEGSIDLHGITLNQHSLDDLFARRLLENWAIFHAEYVEKLRPLNRGISQTGKDLRRLLLKSQRNRASLGSYVDPQQEIDKMRGESL
jgi:hypothetical protein